MPKILIDLDIDDDLKNNIEEKLKNKNLLIKDYILELIQKDIEKTIDFNGYSYSFEFNKLLYEDKEVKFTTIENDLFRYLLNNSNNIMSTDDIHLNIWKDKKMTLFTLRNIIRSIREKTYHKLIKNVSNRGYMLVIDLTSSNGSPKFKINNILNFQLKFIKL